jgi:signal transduction histidine kinase
VPSTTAPRDAEPLADPLRRWRWPIILAAWTIPALLASFETVAFWRMGGRDFPVWRAVALQAPGWLTYALLTPAILALGRRLPLGRHRLVRRLAAHLAAALVVGAAYAATATAASFAFAPAPTVRGPGITFVGWYLSALPMAVLTYFGVLGAGHALAYLEESRRREREAARLAAQLADARLGALRMQLHPHFLFNTLNAITVLARDGDTAAVTRMLGLLSGLLREVLRTDARHHVTVAEEMAFVGRYLAIEEVRFSDRLRVADRADDAARDALVPAFLLQPLVENALRHGLAPRVEGGTIALEARLVPDDSAGGAPALELVVRDDGAGLPPGWRGAESYGIGLSNTAARLAELHGGRASLRIAPAPGGGTVATVRLPLAVQESAARPAPGRAPGAGLAGLSAHAGAS